MHHSFTFVATFFLLQTPLIHAASSSCYFPDGTFAAFDSPCFPDQDVSICCGQGHTCMSNNLCRWPDDQMPFPLAYIRGSCTDSSWNSTDCGNTCKNVFPHQWDPIVSCPGAEFCCDLDDSNPDGCCNLTNSTEHPIFALEAATTVTVIGMTSATPGTSATTIYTGSSTSQTSPASVNSGSSASKKTIGIGVGAAVGGVLMLGLIIILIMRKKRSGQRGSEPYVAELPFEETRKAELAGQQPGDFKGVVANQNAEKPHPVPTYSELDGTGVRPGY